MDARRMQDVEMLIRMEYSRDAGSQADGVRPAALPVPEDVCEAALESLIDNGFLARTPSGEFVQRAAAV